MMNSERNLEFWKTRTNDQAENRPVDYATQPGKAKDIMAFLEENGVTIRHNTSVLDVGCNVGRLLDAFREAGSKPKHLFGIEPNPNAHSERPKHFPDLLESNILQGTASQYLPRLQRKFTFGSAIAVLVHLTDEERMEILNYFNEHCKYIVLGVNKYGTRRQDESGKREGRIWNPDNDLQVSATGATLLAERPWGPHPTWNPQLWRTTRK